MLPLNRPAARSTAASGSARPGLKVLRRACAVAAVALIPVLAGCEAGGDAPVLHWHPPTTGASATNPSQTGICSRGTGSRRMRERLTMSPREMGSGAMSAASPDPVTPCLSDRSGHA